MLVKFLRILDHKICMNLLVAKNSMEIDDELLFILRKLASLDIRPKIIGPPKPATLATPIQPCKLRKSSPTSMPISCYVIHKLLIFFWCPWPFLQSILITTW
uniref:Uncharacterized protein n=1 Tax=Cannabis sativa TaxID=3483 RepID=A0A803PLI1_CANSA